MDNSETLATLGTQDTGRKQTRQINVRENRRGFKDWRIQRHWQHWVHKADTGQRPSKQKNNTTQHNSEKMSNTDLTKTFGELRCS